MAVVLLELCHFPGHRGCRCGSGAGLRLTNSWHLLGLVPIFCK
jgi:hypothetical protein